MKRGVLAFLFCLLLLSWPAQAQEQLTLSSLEVDLRPEYDRPEVLVIYRGWLAPDTPLPAAVEIRIPARVGEPTAVAYADEEGNLLIQSKTTRVEGDWLVISFELVSQGFQIEYYDTLPVDEAGQRAYTFALVADYATASLGVAVQVPPTAEGFVLDPPADLTEQGTGGVSYHLLSIEDVAQGEALSWTFSYQKDNADLTILALAELETQEPATMPIPAPAEAETDSAAWVIFAIAFVALFAVGAAAFWLGRRTQPLPQAAPPPARRPKRRGSGRGAQPRPRRPQELDRLETQFCYECGAQLRHDSDFCHRCGAAVRKG